MTDQPISPEAELASAALDGELTAVERAQLATSPELTADLATFTELRAELAAVPVTAHVREQAIAAALGIFDELAGVRNPDIAAAALPTAPVVPIGSLLTRRQRQYRWLTGVAAAGLVVVVAAGLINQRGDDAKLSSINADAATEAQTKIGGAAPTADSSPQYSIAASETGLGGIYAPAEVSAWALAPGFDTTDQLVAYAKSSSFGVGFEPRPVATAARVSSMLAECPQQATILNKPDTLVAPIVFRGLQLVAIFDQAASELLLVDPSTCSVVANIITD